MDKREFFDSLHKELGKKHTLSYRHVNTIRSFFIGHKKTRKEIAEWCAIKLSQPLRRGGIPHAGHRVEEKAYYQTLLNFVASCSAEAWNDITQITKYDRDTQPS